MTAGEVLADGTALLRASGIETPRLDASLLLAEVLKTDRTRLVLMDADPVDGDKRRLFETLLERRRGGECTAYILGRREFWGLEFTVTPAVLVPRPDTETLVEAALDWIDRHGPAGIPGPALDLCTGSGAVAIALKHERPGIEVYGSDISPPALEVARINAARLAPGERAPCFFAADLFKPLCDTPFPLPLFSLILANPPYIPRETMKTLSREVRGEPPMALDGGEDGLAIIRRLIGEAGSRLKDGGALFIEADPGQMTAVAGLLEHHGYRNISTRRDLSGRDRVIGAFYGNS
jgi:release factor glutamine methyltransferase